MTDDRLSRRKHLAETLRNWVGNVRAEEAKNQWDITERQQVAGRLRNNVGAVLREALQVDAFQSRTDYAIYKDYQLFIVMALDVIGKADERDSPDVLDVVDSMERFADIINAA